MSTTPDGTGTGWTNVETVDIDQPHGLVYRWAQHIAKGVRKRVEKEHATFGDITAGGEHVPGFCQVLRQVDGTADVTTAYDNTLFQANGIVHCSAEETLWCVTGAAGDPTICLIDPNEQYKGGDITWTGAQEFDASVDMTGPLTVDGAATFNGDIDGTHAVLDRVDFSGAGFAGDATFSAAVQIDGTVLVAGDAQIAGDVTISGLMSLGDNNLYDSSWFDCTVLGGYTKTHDLSSTVLLTLLYFKDTANQLGLGADRIYNAVNYHEDVNEFGASINNITPTQLTVQAATPYVNSAMNGTVNVAVSTCGQYRVVAMRLL